MVYQIHPSYGKAEIDQNILRQIASGSLTGVPLTAGDHLTEFMRMAIVDALLDANGEVLLGEKYHYVNPRKDPDHEMEGELADNLIYHCLWTMEDTSALRDNEDCLAKPENPSTIKLNLWDLMKTTTDFTRNWFGTTSVTASIFTIKETDIKDYGWELPIDDMLFFGDEKAYQKFIEGILGRARRLARDLQFMQSSETTTTIFTKNRTEGIMHCLKCTPFTRDYGDLFAVYRDLSLSLMNFQQIFHKIYSLGWPVDTIRQFIHQVKEIASREYCIRIDSGISCMEHRGITLACDQQLEILEKGRKYHR